VNTENNRPVEVKAEAGEEPTCRHGCGPVRDEIGPWHERGCTRWAQNITSFPPEARAEAGEGSLRDDAIRLRNCLRALTDGTGDGDGKLIKEGRKAVIETGYLDHVARPAPADGALRKALGTLVSAVEQWLDTDNSYTGDWDNLVAAAQNGRNALSTPTAPVSPGVRPKIVCLCGSTRFMEQFFISGWDETMKGNIVLSVGVNLKMETPDGGHVGEAMGPGVKEMLDDLHKRKIDLADDVLVLNVGSYIGESTRSEIDYAESHGKPVRYLEVLQSPEPPQSPESEGKSGSAYQAALLRPQAQGEKET
jgi:hypothetical protein